MRLRRRMFNVRRQSRLNCDSDSIVFFFFQAEDGIRDIGVTGVQTCALPISLPPLVVVGVGAWLAVMAGALATALELGLSGTVPLGTVLPAMLGVHALIGVGERSEEHTSELQSRQYLVCRLLLEKKKNIHHRL